MFYADRIMIFLCLFIGLAPFVLTYIHKPELHNIERNITMNNHDFSLNWIKLLKKRADEHSTGSLKAKDKKNNELVLQWHILTTQSALFAPSMNKIGDLASQAFASVEFDFLQAHPEAIPGEQLYQSITPLFQNNASIDWPEVKDRIYSIINQLYTKTDWSKFGADDVYVIVTVHDHESDTLLGFITFFIRPNYPYGVCKVTAMGVAQQAQNRGLGKLLISSIFKIIPEAERIFLSTRVTNAKALAAYHSWGFTTDHNPIQEPGHVFNPDYWIFLEYVTSNSDTLQKTAENLSE